jgi:hypothetical protein
VKQIYGAPVDAHAACDAEIARLKTQLSDASRVNELLTGDLDRETGRGNAAQNRAAAAADEIVALRRREQEVRELITWLTQEMNAGRIVLHGPGWAAYYKLRHHGPETIAKYGEAVHNDPSEVRYVRSSDSAGSGDEIS